MRKALHTLPSFQAPAFHLRSTPHVRVRERAITTLRRCEREPERARASRGKKCSFVWSLARSFVLLTSFFRFLPSSMYCRERTDQQTDRPTRLERRRRQTGRSCSCLGACGA